MKVLTLDLPDGRRLEYATMGSPSGGTVVVHPKETGGVYDLLCFAPLLKHANLFLVGYSQPGTGRSDRHLDGNLSTWQEDLRCLLTYLHRSRYASIGLFRGSLRALSNTVIDAPRCAGALLLISDVPPEHDRFHYDPNEADAVAQGYEELDWDSRAAHVTADELLELYSFVLTDSDRVALADADVRRDIAASVRHSLIHGEGRRGEWSEIIGCWDELDLTQSAAPVEAWYAELDPWYPISYGRWFEENLPTAQSRVFYGEGRFAMILNHLEEMSAWAVSTLARDSKPRGARDV